MNCIFNYNIKYVYNMNYNNIFKYLLDLEYSYNMNIFIYINTKSLSDNIILFNKNNMTMFYINNDNIINISYVVLTNYKELKKLNLEYLYFIYECNYQYMYFCNKKIILFPLVLQKIITEFHNDKLQQYLSLEFNNDKLLFTKKEYLIYEGIMIYCYNLNNTEYLIYNNKIIDINTKLIKENIKCSLFI